MIKVEPNNKDNKDNWSKEKQEEYDARQVHIRIDDYNRDIRERHYKSFKKRQLKNEQMKRHRAEELMASVERADTESDHDMYEVNKMKKTNQKFSRLMAFDIEKQFNKTQHLLGK